MLCGIDVSHYNPDLDWARAHAEGAEFIVHKATEGTGTDPTYARRAPAIRASGAVPGAYHFLRSTPSAAAQVDHFLSVIGDPTGLLIQLDWEISGTDLAPISMARAWVAEFLRRTGNHPVLIYMPHWIWADHLGSPPGLASLGPLWASRYLAAPPAAATLADAARVPASWWAGYGGWEQPAVLQYAGEAGTAAGVGGVDLNIFTGNLADLHQLAGIPTPEDDMPFSLTQHPIPAGFAADATGKLVDRSRALVLGVPLGGATGLTTGWLSLSCDFGSALIRIAIAGRTATDDAAWNVRLVTVAATKGREVIQLPEGCDKLSVGRASLSDTDPDFDVPVTATLELA